MIRTGGDATEILTTIDRFSRAQCETGSDALAYRFTITNPRSKKLERVNAIEERIQKHVRQWLPKALVIVLDASHASRPIEVLGAAQALVSRVSTFASDLLAERILTVGITVNSPRHRETVATRISNFLAAGPRAGGGVAISSDTLQRATIGEVIENGNVFSSKSTTPRVIERSACLSTDPPTL